MKIERMANISTNGYCNACINQTRWCCGMKNKRFALVEADVEVEEGKIFKGGPV